MTPVTIEIFVERNCSSCESVLSVLRQVPELITSEIIVRQRENDLEQFRQKQVMIVPATFINNSLAFYGTFSKDDLEKYIAKYSLIRRSA